MSKNIPLNFNWKFNKSFSKEMIKKDYDDTDFIAVNIPHTNKELPYNYFDEKSYQFISCYRKHFDIEKKDKDEVIFLNFEGASNYSVVYVNGEYVGEHKGGYTPFSFDITDKTVIGDNVITVKLDSTEREEIPPFGRVVDYLTYGGIYREVSLSVKNKCHINNAFVKPKNVLKDEKALDIDIQFSEKYEGKVSFSLFDGEEIIKQKEKNISADKFNLKWNVGNVELWDIDNPKLYTLKIITDTDEYDVKVGFRTAKFKTTGFYLNGKRIKLRGLNRHQSYPYVGYAMPKWAQEQDAVLLKEQLGCNIVRTSHYPDSVHFLNKCDEIGLLVFTEMPSWQYLGEDEWRKNCLDNIEKMIIRDRNHPSVILWGVRVNEGNDCDEFYEETNFLAKELDPTRQTGGVRNIPMSHLLEDVYTYNDFSHSGGNITLMPADVISKSLTAPYLVTEYNGHMFPTKSFDREDLRTEHALRHARVQNKSYSNERYSGAIGWCMADYNTHKDFGSGDRICYHGVTDMFRIPKSAGYFYASQQDKIPVMEISSSMDIGDHPGGMVGQIYIFTNCDYVKVYKNNEFKSIAYPNKKDFPYLPHPPICPADYIGDSLEKEEGLDKKTAKGLKDALVAAGKYGYIMPPQNYLKVVYSFLHGKMTVPQIMDIVTKYFANWGDEQTSYKFEGYKNNKLVKVCEKTAVNSVHYEIVCDKNVLTEDETYDVTKITIKAVDQNGNRLFYNNDVIKTEITGPAEIIGPSDFSLIGGVRAFWVKSNGKKGLSTIKISVNGKMIEEIKLEVR